MPVTMFDSVTVAEIPANPQAVAGYVAGLYPDFSSLVARFPAAHHLSIAVSAFEDAECLDVENGDAVPSQAPDWYKRQVARGVKRPVFYADTSTMPVVLSQLASAGIKRPDYRVWTAHFTGQPHIEAGSDATQWTDAALGRNLDQSLCVDNFFADGPAPKPAQNAPHYERFQRVRLFGKTIDEAKVARSYDGLRRQLTPTRQPVVVRARLAVLRVLCRHLAGRVYNVAHEYPVNGKPSWGRFYRGWRYQQLSARAQGERIV